MFSRTSFIIFLLVISRGSMAQVPVQTLHGKITDKETSEGLPGAVVMLDSLSRSASTSDAEGFFRIDKVPVGRHMIHIRMMGYQPRSIGINVQSGKETVLNPELEAAVVMKGEVVIRSGADKSKSINDMAAVSARSFSIDETRRYAGSLNDPSRMAANFAGVGTNSDARNDIIIRGNSPLGLLWRLNGIDIPNPNHFGSMGSTGGPVSILNNNTLDNSDFLTGAFPAEYGNAISGVFDLRLRKGNDEKFEGLGQVGFNGFELGLEGPLSKKKHGATWLLNYRYSTLGFFKMLGIGFGTGASVPQYQDVTAHVHVPLKNNGFISFFGIAGKSYIELLESKKDTTQVDLYSREGQDIYYGSHTYVAGAMIGLRVGKKSSFRLHTAASGFGNPITTYNFDRRLGTRDLSYGNRSDQNNLHLNAYLLSRIHSGLTLKNGIVVQHSRFVLQDSTLRKGVFAKLRDMKGDMMLVQAYSQLKYNLDRNLWLTTGVHAQYLMQNKTAALEPRAGLRWMPFTDWQFGLGYGILSQSQPVFLYYNRTNLPDGTYLELNKNLQFTKSGQWVISCDYSINEFTRIKAEAYYQSLWNVPVEMSAGTFSALNLGADFGSPSVDSLVSKGKGRNYGMEFTLERFIHKGFYFLSTVSLYHATYRASDDTWYSTAFDGRYIGNLLAGKEWILGNNFTAWTDLRMSLSGGKRYTPFDEAASAAKGERVYKREMNYQLQYPGYARLDVKVGIRKNSRRITQEFIIDIQNATNRRNVFVQDFSFRTNTVVTNYQMGILVIPQYRIYF